jgi:selenocysteine lyase/cysteine desulfurase
MGERNPSSGAGIVSFRKQGLNPVAVIAHLRENGITAAARAGWVRMAPHFYITAADIEKMLASLP